MRDLEVYEQLCGVDVLGAEGRQSEVANHRVLPGATVTVVTDRAINGKSREGKTFPVVQIGSQARKGTMIQINLGDEKSPIIAAVAPAEVQNPNAPSPTAALEAELAKANRRERSSEAGTRRSEGHAGEEPKKSSRRKKKETEEEEI